MSNEELETAVLRAFTKEGTWKNVKLDEKDLIVWEGRAGEWVAVVCVLRRDITKMTATISLPGKGVLFVLSDKPTRVLWDLRRRSAS